ncbi:hypothetical protein [Cryptosporangium japonicum]|uniref:Uncharacterized protein n=1 Tax=Cryptosporangium japonicum TaxID=80872 RepID=A0ABP3EQ11_9ACTN
MTQPGDELGAFTQVRLVHHAAVADLFSGLDQSGRPIVMVALTPEAGVDPAWRSAFSDLVNRDRASVNPADPQFVPAHAGDVQGGRPWVASRFEPGRRGVERILHVIPQALPPGVDPTAMIGSAVAGLQAQQWAPPQAYAPPMPAQPNAPQSAPPMSAPPMSGPPMSAPPMSAMPMSGPPQPAPSPFSDPFSSPLSQSPASAPPASAPPASAPPASAPPMSDPFSTPMGQPSGIPDQYAPISGGPQPGGPQPGGYSPGGYPNQQPAGYYTDSYGDQAAPYDPNKPDVSYASVPPDSSNRRGAGMLIGLITAVTALVIVAAGFAVVFINSGDEKKPVKSVADKSPSTSTSPLPAKTAKPTPTPSRSPLPDTTPTIRPDAETVSVVGPTWQNDDKVQLLALNGWPFAFRLPQGWSCLRGSIDELPDASAWGCVKTEGTSHQQRFNIMLRRCATGCIATEQTTMTEAWFDDDEEAIQKKADATTTYAETAKNDDGFYALTISHFFAEKPGGELTYQVGVWFQSPDKYKDEMQKGLNDVRTQAPQPA